MSKLKESVEEDWFQERTDNHIRLVQRAAAKIAEELPELEEVVTQAETHDSLKFEEPERTPYIQLTWLKKQGEKAEGDLQDQITQATLHHIKNSHHHPEYHLEDKTKANLSDERVKRWEEECFMPYEELSEEMKEYDREYARKVLEIITNHT